MTSRQKIYRMSDWYTFANGYLELARLACVEIIGHKNSKYSRSAKGKPKRILHEFELKEIFIPALFNTKHGIEVLLKTLIVNLLNKEMLEKGDYSHNIEEIFNRLEAQEHLQEKKINDSTEFTNKYFTKGSGSKNIFQDWKKDMLALKELVYKYHNLDFLKEKIKADYSIEDQENTAFKYPTNNLKIQLDYKNMVSRLKKEDVEILLMDINSLKSIFFLLFLGFQNWPSDKKIIGVEEQGNFTQKK